MTEKAFSTSSTYLKMVSIFMMILGLFWMFSGSFDPFGIYQHYFANHFWQTEVPPEAAQTTFSFLMILFGAMLVGFFTMYYFLIHHGFKTKQLWVWQTAVYGILTWFVIDTLMCISIGAYFNIILANITTLALVSPLFFMRKNFC